MKIKKDAHEVRPSIRSRYPFLVSRYPMAENITMTAAITLRSNVCGTAPAAAKSTASVKYVMSVVFLSQKSAP